MDQHTHTNLLIHESSPYLLQHAHNPVNWHAWGEEAWNKAKLEDKPVLVSIGYAACHWCHVMEKESFENEETAAIMNAHFINIKIDREERPDLDHIYMDALQAMAGQGGWPLNVFLTPDKKPFYGGTYFPPKRMYNRMSWNEVLAAVENAYNTKKDDILLQAEKLTQHLQKLNEQSFTSKDKEAIFDVANPRLIADTLMQNADLVFGGFGGAPKFPQTAAIIYLLRQYLWEKNESHLQQALLGLDKMMQGGIYDQIGGGFARYSTDEKWLAPHFEKMLYDNALLLMAYTEAYQLTRDKKYEVIIRQIFEFLEREMMHKKGGFYSALDADSEGVEGKFYTWKKNEIEDILGNDASLFCQVYDVQENGNWENTNILWLPISLKEMADNLKITPEALQEKLNFCSEKLLRERSKRIRPATDTKILSGWNALVISAYCNASMALNDDALKLRAISTMEFLEKNCMDKDESWLHAASENPRQPAFLDDLAYIIQAYILLQEMTGETNYLQKAKSLTEFVIAHFSDSDNCFFYFTPQMQNDILYRKIEIYDGATPSGNAMMAQNLLYLSKVYDLKAWEERSVNMLQAIGKNILLHPLSFGNWALQVQAMIAGIPEIVVTGVSAGDVKAEIVQHYIPSRILQFALSPNDDFPMLKEKIFDKRNAMIYLCRNYSCEKPVKSAEQLFLLLKY